MQDLEYWGKEASVAQPVGVGHNTFSNIANVSILLVEDSRTQALYLRQTLESSGYVVNVAENGRAALEYLAANEPTLIISDIVMPEMDGFEFCSRVKHNKTLGKIPVILVTFLSDPADILNGLKSGADNFITKPYNDSELLSRIQYILANRELRRRSEAGLKIEIFFGGRKHILTAERLQIIDLLLSSFETAVTHKSELEKANRQYRELNDRLKIEIAEHKKAEEEKEKVIGELQKALAEVKKLSGLLPICASCKRIRDDKGYWQQIEGYIRDHSEADFSHGICPECTKKLYPEFYTKD